MVFDRRCRGLSSIPSDAATFTTLELTESDELSLAAPVIVRTLDPVLLNGVRPLAPQETSTAVRVALLRPNNHLVTVGVRKGELSTSP
jgi:hypothetical protein